jgi:hypothetical protein
MSATTSTTPLRPRRSSVFLPKEHGSWSLALEPLALGLLVAPSPAGGALALATVAAFFARRPLKSLLAGNSATPRRDAWAALLLLGACSVTGLIFSAAPAGIAPLWPLLCAAPLGALFLHFDRQNESRAAAAELAGSAAFALLPATLATLAGWPAPAALALAAAMLARSIPTVLTVRTLLRFSKGGVASPFWPLLAASGALIALAALRAVHLAPIAAPFLAAALLVRTFILVTPLRPAWSARRIGFSEAIIGVLYFAILTLCWHAP